MPPKYYYYIRQLVIEMSILVAPTPKLLVDKSWKDRLFDDRKSILAMHTTMYIMSLVEDRAWLVVMVRLTWHITHCMQ